MLIEQNRLISDANLCEFFSICWRPISNFAVYRCVLISEITRYNLQVDAKDISCVISTNDVYL